MKDLFSFYEYEQVICISINEHRDLRICQSSNRLIEMEEIKRIGVDTVVNKQCGVYVKNIFSKYYQAQTEGEPTIDENCSIISSVNKFMEDLRHDLIQDNRTMFDKSQILFCLPLKWTKDEHKNAMRALFSASGWITHKDHKRRLIFCSSLERLVNYLRDQNHLNKKFERERRYLFCHINDTSLTLTCFQMQSAKELISVTRKLAASDFLLVPTILDNQSFSLSNLDAMIYNKIKTMITANIASSGPRNIIHNKPGVHTLIGKITKYISYVYSADKNGRSHVYLDVVLSEYSSFFQYKSVQEFLKSWTCGSFINEVLNDKSVKQMVQDCLNELKKTLASYSCIKDSPEAVQDIVLYTDCESTNTFHKNLIRDVLLNDDVIDSDNNFIDVFDDTRLCEGAMQRPYKMIQIANAILPPKMWNNHDSTGLYSAQYQSDEIDLLPPNSFYLQCQLNPGQVEFILNKIVVVSVNENTSLKSTFTIRQELVDIDNMVDSACDLMWNHYYQALYFANMTGILKRCCNQHEPKMLSINNHSHFTTNLKKLIQTWLQEEYVLFNTEIDTEHVVHISGDCNCSLNITHRLLLEVGLKPAIKNMAAVTVATLASDDLFGRYNISGFILTAGNDVFGNNAYYQYHSNIIFRDSVSRYLKKYEKNPAVFFSKEELMSCQKIGHWSIDKDQIFGQGSYTQLSGASYGIKCFADGNVRHGSFNGMYEYNENAYKKNRVVHAFPNLIILSKDEHLPYQGSSKVLVLHNYNIRRIGLYTLNSPENDTNWQRIWFLASLRMNHSFPLTVRISPQNYSSTIKVELMYVGNSKPPVLQTEYITIHERLTLKLKPQ